MQRICRVSHALRGVVHLSHVVVAMRFGIALCSTLILVELLVVVRLHNLLAQFLLPLVYVCVEFVPIFSNREFLIVVNRDMYSSRAYWFIFRIMELRNERMSQGLLSTQTLVWIELK